LVQIPFLGFSIFQAVFGAIAIGMAGLAVPARRRWPGVVLELAASEPAAQLVEAIIEADPRSPLQNLARVPLVEPVGGGHLLDDEPGGRRVSDRTVRAKSIMDRPGGLYDGRDGRGQRHWDMPSGRRYTSGSADRSQQFRDRTRLAIGDDQRLTPGLDTAFQCGHDCVDRIRQVRAVQEGCAGADQWQTPPSSTVDHASDQLGITGSPDQVGADGHYGEITGIGTQDDLLGDSLAPSVRSAGTDWVSRLGSHARQ
jgi:hypothetical protein